jgi:PAS domain S-box-containing protein
MTPKAPARGRPRPAVRGGREPEVRKLRRRLAEAEDALRAIREGEVDAIIVKGSRGNRIFSLSESESIYRLMVETMSEAGLAVSPEGTVLFANDCFVRMVGRPLSKVLGSRLGDFVDKASRRRLQGLLAKARSGPAEARIVLEPEDGAPMPVYAWANLLERPDGPTVCLVGIDISQLETSAELIEDLKEQRGALAASRRELERRFIELEERNQELARFNQAAVGRELRIVELKKQVNELSVLLGRPRPYPLRFEDG